MRAPFAALAILSLALTGPSSVGIAAESAPGVGGSKITIGAYDALTGPIPLTGAQMQFGWRAAVGAVNDAGGIAGRKLELAIEDDQYEPSRSLAAVRKLVDRDHVFLVTGLGTPTTVVDAGYLNGAGVPLLFPMGASSKKLNEAGLGELFMLHPAYSSQVDIVTDWLIKNAGVKSPCIIYLEGANGDDLLLGYNTAVQANNLKSISEAVEASTLDFGAPVLKLKNAGCDLVFTGTSLEGSARIVKAADNLGWRPKFAGVTTQADATLIKLLGPLAEGFYAADIMFRDPSNPGVGQYLADLKKYSPEAAPTFFTAYAYASMKIIAKALQDAGSNPTREGLVAKLEQWHDVDGGMLGPISFSKESHDGKKSMYILQVKDGKFERVSDWVAAK